jgi:hypothetical protein
VGAAVGVGADLEERVDLLAKEGVDVIVVDTAHGFSAGVLRAVERSAVGLARPAGDRRERGHG